MSENRIEELHIGEGVLKPFIGSTTEHIGVAGLVPAPNQEDINKVLSSNGTWIDSLDTKNTAGATKLTNEYGMKILGTINDGSEYALTYACSNLRVTPSGDIIKDIDTHVLFDTNNNYDSPILTTRSLNIVLSDHTVKYCKLLGKLGPFMLDVFGPYSIFELNGFESNDKLIPIFYDDEFRIVSSPTGQVLEYMTYSKKIEIYCDNYTTAAIRGLSISSWVDIGYIKYFRCNITNGSSIVFNRVENLYQPNYNGTMSKLDITFYYNQDSQSLEVTCIQYCWI